MIGGYNLSKQNIEGKKKRGDSQLANEHTQGDEHTQGAVPCLTKEACNEDDAPHRRLVQLLNPCPYWQR
jgi:hypothetical protein